MAEALAPSLACSVAHHDAAGWLADVAARGVILAIAYAVISLMYLLLTIAHLTGWWG